MSIVVAAVFILTLNKLVRLMKRFILKLFSLYKWWKRTLQIILFFFQWDVITIG